jgi:hypothetical protein
MSSVGIERHRREQGSQVRADLPCNEKTPASSDARGCEGVADYAVASEPATVTRVYGDHW